MTKKEVQVDAEVPRAWIVWPLRVSCKECGQEHQLDYEDVRQCCPVFGYE